MNRQTLYALKREFGAALSIYSNAATTTDTVTGARAVGTAVYPIDLAIVLPAKLSRNDKRGISLTSANKDLVQGGFYDSTQRRFIIDRSDVPDLILSVSDWLVYKNRKYQIETIDEFENNAAWLITGKAVVGEVPQQIFLVSADNVAAFSDGVES